VNNDNLDCRLCDKNEVVWTKNYLFNDINASLTSYPDALFLSSFISPTPLINQGNGSGLWRYYYPCLSKGFCMIP